MLRDTTKKRDRAARWAVGVSLLALGVWVAVVVVTADRGFDPSDEGFYLLSYRWWDSTPRAFSGVQYLYGPVFGWLGDSVPGLRIFRLVTILVAHGVLGWAVASWLRARALGGLVVVLAVMLSGAVMYGSLPLSPGYNDVTALASVLLAAAVLRTFGAVELAGRLPVLPALGAGLIVVLLVAAKWSAAVVVVAAVAPVVLLALRRSGARGWRPFVAGFSGGAVAGSLILVALAGGFDSISTMFTVNRLAAREGHSPGALLGVYLRSVLEMGLLAGALAVVPALCLAGAVLLRRRGSTTTAHVVAVAGPVVLLLLSWPTRFGLPEGGAHHVPRYAAVLIALVGLVVVISRGLADPRDRVVVGVLLALPVLQVVGTDNALYLVAVNGLGCWTAAILICLVRTRSGSVARTTGTAAVVVVVAVALAVGLSGILEHPYRTDAPGQADHRIGGSSPVEGLKVSEQQATWFAGVRAAVGPRAAGEPILAFDELAGLVLALDGRSVGEAWYSSRDHDRTAAGIRSVCTHPRPWGATLPVVIFNRVPTEGDRAALRACGADLDRDYDRTVVDGLEPVTVYRPR